jgi:hypothetical protein
LTRTRIQSQRLFLLLALLILLLGLTVRIIALTRLPLYFDEAEYIVWAQDVLHGHPFVGDLRKLAFFPILSLFNPTGPESAWIARSMSAIFSTLTVASCIALGRMMASRRAGLTAGLLYALLPFAVFHERTVIAEPLQSTLLAFSLVLMVQLARKPHLARAVALGLVLALAHLVKNSSLLYLALPPVAAFILAQERWRAVRLGILSSIIAVGTVLFVSWRVSLAIPPATVADIALTPIQAAGAGAVPGQWDWPTISRNLLDYAELMQVYLGWAIIALILAAPLWLIIDKKLRLPLLFLFIPAIVFVIPILITRTIDSIVIAPRFIFQTAIALTVIAALSLDALMRSQHTRIGRLPRTAASVISVGLLGLAVINGLWFSAALIRDPREARLYKSDRVNFVRGFLSGGGFPEMTDDLLAQWRQNPDTPIHILGPNKSIRWVSAYMGSRVVDTDYIHRGSRSQGEAIAQWLGHGDAVYFLSGSSEDFIAEEIHGTQLDVIKQYDTNMYGPLYLLAVIGVKGTAADEVYNQRVAKAEQMGGDYAQLNAAIQNSGAVQVIIFPAGHAAYLSAISNTEVTPLTIGTWPPSADDLAASLVNALPEGDRQPATIVLIDEAHADPDRHVILALHDYCYQTGDAWFGLQHLISCITGPSDPPLNVLDAWYEDVITLKQGAVLDQKVHAGEVVRVAVIWETTTPIEDEWRIFSHVMDTSTGTLQAQYDSIPGGGLLPMTSWQVGEDVHDHFAISLPADLSTGEYEVRIGIYHPVSGARLPVTHGKDAGPDYVVVGRFVVVP